MRDDLAKTETQGAKQLVLGFDAGCFTCSDLATRIEERVGEKLAVRNLRDPELQGWREQALGGDTKWAPTLFEVEGDQVRAWTGWKMGWALSRSIGPTATWKVMQALGEVGAAPKIEGSAVVEKLPDKAADAMVGMSRSGFLKGVGGAAVAMSMLSGTDLLAPQAEAAGRGKNPYDPIGSRRITGRELTRVARQLGSSVDVKNLVGYALSTPARVKAARPVAFMHKLRNGSRQRIVMYRVSQDRTVAHVQFSNPPKSRAASRAVILQRDSKKSTVVKASEGGWLWRVDADFLSAARSEGGIVPLGECPPITNNPPGNDACWITTEACVDWRMTGWCAGDLIFGAISCGTCVSAIAATAPTGGVSLTLLSACSACAYESGATMKSCCARWCKVQAWRGGPGCGVQPRGPVT